MLDDLARVHDGDPVAQLGHDAEVVRDEQNTRMGSLLQLSDDSQHLRTLARLSRLISSEGFLDALRTAESSTEALSVVRKFEREIDDD